MIVVNVVNKWDAPGVLNHSAALLLTRPVVTVPVIKLLWTCVMAINSVNRVLSMVVFGMVATAPHNHQVKVC